MPNSTYQMNLRWLQSKKDGKGNYALGDADTNNRGGRDLSHALILASSVSIINSTS